MIRLSQVKMPLKHEREAIEIQILKQLRIKPAELNHWQIRKESLDARKEPPVVVYTIDCEVTGESKLLSKNKSLQQSPNESYVMPITEPSAPTLQHRPVVIGFGPAGMFAAWLLTELGYKPLVLERGADVDQRSEDIQSYWQGGPLKPESNVQFGEGGAGTFSDGKLTTRIKDLRAKTVLELLAAHGAPEDVQYRNKPHIGTDILKPTVKKFREKLIAKGAEIRFNTRVEQLCFNNDQLEALLLADGTRIPAETAVLAIGHSARDTFEMLDQAKVAMTQKPFAIGVRIEHPQSLIDTTQYGKHETELSERFGAAEYHLSTEAENGRSVYTFCMCPGGFVVGAASELDTIVTNGMSEHARNQPNANSALLVGITPEDFPSDRILAGMDLQRAIERKAFELGQCSHKAPVMTVGAFLDSTQPNQIGSIHPSYTPGYVMADLAEGLPAPLIEAMRDALPKLDRKLKGFAMSDAVMTGFETRTSSPVRIVRDQQTLESTSHQGVYPCGEGAGYAGGIMSSACDGLRVAEKIIERWAPPK